MSDWKKEPPISEEQLRETLEQAHKALSEIAMTKGLDPGGERARDMCADALQKMGHGARRARRY